MSLPEMLHSSLEATGPCPSLVVGDLTCYCVVFVVPITKAVHLIDPFGYKLPSDMQDILSNLYNSNADMQDILSNFYNSNDLQPEWQDQAWSLDCSTTAAPLAV